MTRRVLAGLALLATLAFGASCAKPASNTGTGATAKASPTLSPKDAIVNSVKPLSQTSYTYTMKTGPLSGNGAADPTKKTMSVSASGQEAGVSVKIDLILIQNDGWMKLDLGGMNAQVNIPTQWMHVNIGKLNASGHLGIDTTGGDPANSAGIVNGLVDAQRIDSTHYKGTLDLTKSSAGAIDSDTLSKLGDKAKAVPATFTLDDQGRLIDMTVGLASLGITEVTDLEATYADFGKPIAVAAPSPSDVVEAPDTLYGMFQ